MKTSTLWAVGALITSIIWRGPLALGYVTRSALRAVAGWQGWSGVEYELPATQSQTTEITRL